MFSMSRTPIAAPDNIMATIVAFAQAVVSPEWMKQAVDTAQAVAKANELTTEELVAIDAAKQVLADAAGIQARLDAQQQAIEKGRLELKQAADKLEARDREQDQRNTNLGGVEQALTQRETVATKALDRARVAQQNADDAARANQQRIAALDAREQAIAARERAFTTARDIVNKSIPLAASAAQ